MFKDKYIRDNQNINLDETAKEAIKAKLNSDFRKKKNIINFKSIMATALVLCLVLGIVFFATQKYPSFTSVPTEPIVASVTYDDIYDSINPIIKEYNREPGLFEKLGYLFFGGIGSDSEELIEDEAATNTNGSVVYEEYKGEITTDDGASEKPGDSSTTNNQVVGVDEADIVKNDGRYIYSLSGGRLIITDTNFGSPVKVSETVLEQNDKYTINMFVSGNSLGIIYSAYYSEEKTFISIYNIADKAKPVEVATISQSGSYHNARMIDGTVYLLSNHYINSSKISRDKPEEFVPCVNSSPIEAENISIIKGFTEPTYLVISAIDIKEAKAYEQVAVLGGAENIYCNDKHLYYTFTNYDSSKTFLKKTSEITTTIVKLSLGKEKIEKVASGSVKGYPLNQFSMDEYEENLRIVTTQRSHTDDITGMRDDSEDSVISLSSEDTSNALYVLDKDLKVIGSVENLAKDERVYSVRFDKEVGYFVTFRETDPLFTVNLSDPENPTVMSALKIPGFSEYLHPYGEGLLFGFGKEATESGAVTGLKLSMFDVSNPYDVSEASKALVDADWSEASYDHKAIMVDVKKNIIAFTAYSYGGEAKLYVYGYEKGKGFFLKNNTKIDGEYYASNGRFVYIGDYFYLVTESGIYAFSLSTFNQLGYLNF